jgi:hypothetical protein
MKVFQGWLLIVCCIGVGAFVAKTGHYANSKAGHAGQLLTLWLILTAIIWVILKACAKLDQHLSHGEFWEEMQEHWDGTHDSQTEEQ